MYVVSIVFVVVTLMALTGSLERKEPEAVAPSIRGRNVTVPATIQIFLFLGGILTTTVAGLVALL